MLKATAILERLNDGVTRLTDVTNKESMVIPDARLKFQRRTRSLQHLASEGTDGPRRLALAVLRLWQRSAYPKLVEGARVQWGTAELMSNGQVKQFATWLGAQSFNEAAYWLATAYATWVGAAHREAHALYFTPPALAERVIDNLVEGGASLTKHHWHDPACGGAAFLVPIAQRMAAAIAAEGASPLAVLQRLQAQLSGNDLDKTLLHLSEQFLQMALYSFVERAFTTPSFSLSRGDGLLLKLNEADKPDVLACNPPYRKLRSKEADKYRSDYAPVIEGQPNIYGLFIHQALRLTRRGGLVGLLTPTSYLSGQYFSKLRTELLSVADTLHIDMLSHRSATFLGVEQETAISILRVREPRAASAVTTNVCVLTRDDGFVDVGQCVLPNSGKPWPVPRGVEDADLLRTAQRSLHRLSHYGYVPKVGHLVGYRDTRRRYKTLPQVSAGHLPVYPLVWATDISPSGRFEHGREQRKHRPELFVEVESHAHTSVLKRQAVLLQRLTSSDQSRRLVAAPVPKSWLEQYGGFVSENHVIALEKTDDSPWNPGELALLLNSATVDRVFRAISGASNVALFELNELPLPDPAVLRAQLTDTDDLEQAVLQAYEHNNG